MITAQLGAILAGSGVVFGAFGTHALSETLSIERLETYETAVRYQMYHGLALLAIATFGSKVVWAVWFLFGGTLLFSGSLYLLILTDREWLGMITPVGGVLQLIGWIFFILRVRTSIKVRRIS
ncbi:MAG: DUF423 domain-containing protein [Trueperaceae bacterium]|nr:MAG: DUF423 domain-containing protein [Trueperaceae bacterium]